MSRTIFISLALATSSLTQIQAANIVPPPAPATKISPSLSAGDLPGLLHPVDGNTILKIPLATPDPKAKITFGLNQVDADIRTAILKQTPLGSDPLAVYSFVKTNLVFLPTRLIFERRNGHGVIFLCLAKDAAPGSTFLTSGLFCNWLFSDKDKLVDVTVTRETDGP